MTFAELVRELAAGGRVPEFDPTLLERPDAVARLAEFGTWSLGYQPGGVTEEQLQRTFREVRDWIARSVDHFRLNAVYVDTTTLRTVHQLISREDASRFLLAETLLDLNTFANAVVLYDNIIHLENPYVDSRRFNEFLGNRQIFVSLPVGTFDGEIIQDGLNSLGGVLLGLWRDVRGMLQSLKYREPEEPAFEDMTEIQQGWRILLGEGFSLTEMFDDRGGVWYSEAPRLLNQLVQATDAADQWAGFRHWAEDRIYPGVTSFVSECNHRSLFNQAVAYLLKLHYLPNCTRLPFRRFLYNRAADVQHVLPSIQRLEAEYRRIARTYDAPQEPNLLLPFFLGAVLSRISSLSEFFEALAEVRDQAEPFRSRRRELDEALRRNDLNEVDKLQSALKKDAEQLRFRLPALFGAIAAVLAAVTSSPTPVLLTAIGALTGASQMTDDIKKLRERILYPQYWFLADLNLTARSMTNALPQVGQLWSLDRAHMDRLAVRFERVRELAYG